MEHPTRERVDEALEAESALRTTNVGYTDWSNHEKDRITLAAEVRALREQLASVTELGLVTLAACDLLNRENGLQLAAIERQKADEAVFAAEFHKRVAERDACVASLARVAALPAAYRALPRGRGYAGCDPLGVAEAIEAALKGES